MTADTTCDRETKQAERQRAAETAAANALLEESESEREERLELVRVAQALVRAALAHDLALGDEPAEK
ncbi:MAG TPA: hypothetical protein VFU88_13900 [Ktedonobacterales bacterium]|jgi:hypothetical protein|nr:hypothetical protein [Ktedonobacterales bacterium]